MQGEKADPWKHRSKGMRCRSCMFFVEKKPAEPDNPEPAKKAEKGPWNIYRIIGRCRRHAPTMDGFPVVFPDDWCGDHKLDEERV